MTGEDVHGDGVTHARESVIHEAGLFQGRLGFERAIILLEEGCAQFSNIHGLTTIRFPKGNIEPKFEEIRRVLEREVASGDKRRGHREAAESDAESQRLREQQDLEDYISYMTEEERKIIATSSLITTRCSSIRSTVATRTRYYPEALSSWRSGEAKDSPNTKCRLQFPSIYGQC